MLQVELDDEHIKCRLCCHKFSCDIYSEIPEIRRHLPILSSAITCCHYVCLGCVKKLLRDQQPRNRIWAACPLCREAKAFSPSNLKYHTMLIGLLEKARDPLFDKAIKADSEDVNEIETNLKGNSVEKNTMSIKVEDSAHDGKNVESDNEIEVYYSKDIKRKKLNHQLAQKKKASDCMVKGEDEVDEQTLQEIRREMQYCHDIEMARHHSIIEQEIPKKKRTRTEPIRFIETQSEKVVGDSRTARMHSLQNGTLYESTFSSSLPNNSSSESSDNEVSSNDESEDCQSSDDKANPIFDDSSSDSEASADDKTMVNPRFDGSSSNSNSSDEAMVNPRLDGPSSDSDSSGSQPSDDEAKIDNSSNESSSHSSIDEQSSDDEDSCEDSNTSDDSSDKR